MDEYGPSSYGDAFADVYDQWYGDPGPAGTAVERLEALAGTGPVLELGVGTGRLAIPLAERGLAVWGIDASSAMLARLTAKPGGERVRAVLGDMAEVAVGAETPPFSLVFVAVNTLFNLVDTDAQARCFAGVARALAPGGRFVVEAFVPADDPSPSGVEVREVAVDHVVLTVSRQEPTDQVVNGQHIEISAAGIRLRPWRVRWATPAQLDAMASAARLELAERAAGWGGEVFTAASACHVSVYERR